MPNKNQPVQSTNHIMVMEPKGFYSNPETMATNSYQHTNPDDVSDVQSKAVAELRAFRDLLVENGVVVTTTLGQVGCPDDIFCNNWISTHENNRMVLYPMLADNRRTERRPDLIKILRHMYTDIQDFTAHEQNNKFLEATGALCMDRINRIAYHARSQRSHDDLAQMWCKMNDYKLISFDTEHQGKPVYHTDVVMWIGTNVAGISSECLKNDDALKHLKHNREVIEFTNEQMRNFCGNSLEVIGEGGERMLVMSAAGYNSLRDDQKEVLAHHYKTILNPEIPTIEYYGGGSARCMLLELF